MKQISFIPKILSFCLFPYFLDQSLKQCKLINPQSFNSMLNDILLKLSRTKAFQVVCTCRPVLERARSSHRSVAWKKLFLKISQNSQEKTFARVFFLRFSFLTVFIRLQALIQNVREACNLSKKRLWNRCFPVIFQKCLRSIFFKEDLQAAFSALNYQRGDSSVYLI